MFDILILGIVDSIKVIGYFQVIVLIVPDLKLNILLGTEFLKVNNLVIDYPY